MLCVLTIQEANLPTNVPQNIKYYYYVINLIDLKLVF